MKRNGRYLGFIIFQSAEELDGEARILSCGFGQEVLQSSISQQGTNPVDQAQLFQNINIGEFCYQVSTVIEMRKTEFLVISNQFDAHRIGWHRGIGFSDSLRGGTRFSLRTF